MMDDDDGIPSFVPGEGNDTQGADMVHTRGPLVRSISNDLTRVTSRACCCIRLLTIVDIARAPKINAPAMTPPTTGHSHEGDCFPLSATRSSHSALGTLTTTACRGRGSDEGVGDLAGPVLTWVCRGWDEGHQIGGHDQAGRDHLDGKYRLL